MESSLPAKIAILAALVSSKSYGLEIIERVDKASRGLIALNEGSVYPMLRTLERDGLLKSSTGDPLAERGGRPRRYYELTAQGRREAREQGTAIVGVLRLAGVV
jgi:PadR family transcriptional regulator, regulatory protein PadR